MSAPIQLPDTRFAVSTPTTGKLWSSISIHYRPLLEDKNRCPWHLDAAPLAVRELPDLPTLPPPASGAHGQGRPFGIRPALLRLVRNDLRSSAGPSYGAGEGRPAYRITLSATRFAPTRVKHLVLRRIEHTPADKVVLDIYRAYPASGQRGDHGRRQLENYEACWVEARHDRYAASTCWPITSRP